MAKEDVPDEVRKAVPGREFKFGREYVVPTPFDPRLMERIACAVADAAAKSGVARTPIDDFETYKRQLKELLAG